jgi:hypothetical protein
MAEQSPIDEHCNTSIVHTGSFCLALIVTGGVPRNAASDVARPPSTPILRWITPKSIRGKRGEHHGECQCQERKSVVHGLSGRRQDTAGVQSRQTEVQRISPVSRFSASPATNPPTTCSTSFSSRRLPTTPRMRQSRRVPASTRRFTSSAGFTCSARCTRASSHSSAP